uniref:Uncharacterized protein n=1 Tax=Avena sativa TaxID=4498 RepID=A0ACD5U1X2_AVESA
MRGWCQKLGSDGFDQVKNPISNGLAGQKGAQLCRIYLPCHTAHHPVSLHNMFTVACSDHTELYQLGNVYLVKSSGLAALPTMLYSIYTMLIKWSSFYTKPLHLHLPPNKHTHTPMQRDSYPRAMFNPSSSSVPTYSDLSMNQAVNFSSDLHTAPTEIPRGNALFHDNSGLFPPLGFAASAPPPYASSLHSYYTNKQGTSSHSFPLYPPQFPDPVNSNAAFSCLSPSAFQLPLLPPVSSSPSSSSGDLLEFSSGPGTVRRVLSTGDLQGNNVSLPPPPIPPRFLPGDNCGSQEAAGEPFSEKVGRYSAEERKERIERYRSKRQQRNFHKKITYACRKTLADSRPRVQGRFARNVETEEGEGDAGADLETEASGISYEYNLSGGRCYDSQSQCSRETGGDSMVFDDSKWWWWGTAVAANGQQPLQQSVGFDVIAADEEEQLWASLADMCSGT